MVKCGGSRVKWKPGEMGATGVKMIDTLLNESVWNEHEHDLCLAPWDGLL